MDRTVRIQLQPKREQSHAKLETLTQFTFVYNHVCAYGWQHGEKNGVKLHHATYYETKARVGCCQTAYRLKPRLRDKPLAFAMGYLTKMISFHS